MNLLEQIGNFYCQVLFLYLFNGLCGCSLVFYHFDLTEIIFNIVYLQCFIVSTVNALQTPMINASMVSFLKELFQVSVSFSNCLSVRLSICLSLSILLPHMLFLHQVLCDRHYGGINYPVGGVGGIAKSLANGLVEQGSEILYKANVTGIIIDHGKAVSSTLCLYNNQKSDFIVDYILIFM